MRIIRFVDDGGRVHHAGARRRSAWLLKGSIFDQPHVPSEQAIVKLLSPIAPPNSSHRAELGQTPRPRRTLRSF